MEQCNSMILRSKSNQTRAVLFGSVTTPRVLYFLLFYCSFYIYLHRYKENNSLSNPPAPPTVCTGVNRTQVGSMFGTDCECVCVYIHLFAQRYPACVRPTGVAQLSIVEVYKNPSLTKREQTAAVCSGFPNKHSTRSEEGREGGS